jgi:hypothetical protein
LHCAVRQQEHLICEIFHHYRAVGMNLDSEQRLVLLRRDTGGGGDDVAEGQKPA